MYCYQPATDGEASVMVCSAPVSIEPIGIRYYPRKRRVRSRYACVWQTLRRFEENVYDYRGRSHGLAYR